MEKRRGLEGVRADCLRADYPAAQLGACAISAPSRHRIRPRGHAGAHAHWRPRADWLPQGSETRGGAEPSCLGYEIIPGGGARVAPPPESSSSNERGVRQTPLAIRSGNGCRADTGRRTRTRAHGTHARSGRWLEAPGARLGELPAAGAAMGEADAGTPSFEMTWSSTTSSGYCSQEDSDSELEQYFTARTSLGRRPRRDQVGAEAAGGGPGAVAGPRPCPVSFRGQSSWAAPRSRQRGSRADPGQPVEPCVGLSARGSWQRGLAGSQTGPTRGSSYVAWGRRGTGTVRL